MLLKKILGYLNLLKELNILKTLYFNFKVFPVQIALKTPVYFFGPVKFGSLTGKITLEVAEISRGMIHFGSDSERVIVSNQPTSLAVEGELVFCGVSKFGFALQLFVWSNGKLIIGDNCWIGSFTRLIAFRSITIGNNFLASWNCQLFDTNFHFIEGSCDHAGCACCHGRRAASCRNAMALCAAALGTVAAAGRGRGYRRWP